MTRTADHGCQLRTRRRVRPPPRPAWGLTGAGRQRQLRLAACTSLLTSPLLRKEDVLKLRLESYLEWSPQIVDGLIWAAKFLDGEHIHTASDLPYPKQIVPLAVLRVTLGQASDAYGVKARIRQWFWSGIFGELYGSAIETRFARDVEQVPAWALNEDDALLPRTVEESYFNESRLHSLRTRNSAAWGCTRC